MARQKKKTPKFKMEMGWGGVISVFTGALAAILWTFVLGVWVGKKVATPSASIIESSVEESYGEGGAKKEAPAERAPLFTMEKAPALPVSGKKEVELAGRKSMPQPSLREASRAEGIQEEPITTKEASIAVASRPRPASKPRVAPKPPVPPKESKKKLSKSRTRTYFALQVASFRDSKYAQREVVRWKNLGYEATLKKVDLGPKKGTWYRVFVGRYESIREARKGALELARKFKQKSYIRPVR